MKFMFGLSSVATIALSFPRVYEFTVYFPESTDILNKPTIKTNNNHQRKGIGTGMNGFVAHTGKLVYHRGWQ